MTPSARNLGSRRCNPVLGDGLCSLAQLGKRCPARIVGFASDDIITRRLFDLGFAPGQIAELVRRAPLRDPLMFCVDGCEIVLRRAEAERILVEMQ